MGVVALAGAIALFATSCTPYVVDATWGTDGKLDLASSNYLTIRSWPAADGGFYRQIDNSNRDILRYLPDGSQDAGFDVPSALGGVRFAGQQPDGDLVLTGLVVSIVNFQSVILMNRTTGAFTFTVLPNGPNRADVLADGRIVAASGLSTGNVAVRTFTDTGTESAVFTYTPGTGLGSNCSGGPPVVISALEDGTTVVASHRCSGSTPIGVEVTKLLPNGALDPSFGGGDGRATLAATDDGIATTTLREVVMSEDGSALVLSSGGTAQRLNSAGELDNAFGLVSVSGAVGGTPTSLVADGTGYVASRAAPTDQCATGPARVRKIDSAGALSGSLYLPFSLDGADLGRYPDGRLLVTGATRSVGAGTTCVAPEIAHATRLLLPG